MSDVIKLSKEELDTLKKYQQKNDLIVLRLGRTDVQKAILEGYGITDLSVGYWVD